MAGRIRSRENFRRQGVGDGGARRILVLDLLLALACLDGQLLRRLRRAVFGVENAIGVAHGLELLPNHFDRGWPSLHDEQHLFLEAGPMGLCGSSVEVRHFLLGRPIEPDHDEHKRQDLRLPRFSVKHSAAWAEMAIGMPTTNGSGRSSMRPQLETGCGGIEGSEESSGITLRAPARWVCWYLALEGIANAVRRAPETEMGLNLSTTLEDM